MVPRYNLGVQGARAVVLGTSMWEKADVAARVLDILAAAACTRHTPKSARCALLFLVLGPETIRTAMRNRIDSGGYPPMWNKFGANLWVG